MQASRATAVAAAPTALHRHAATNALPALYFVKLRNSSDRLSSGILVRHKNIWLFFHKTPADKQPVADQKSRAPLYAASYLYKHTAGEFGDYVLRDTDSPEFVQHPNQGDRVVVVHVLYPRFVGRDSPYVVDEIYMPPSHQLPSPSHMRFLDGTPSEFIHCITSAVDAWRALVSGPAVRLPAAPSSRASRASPSRTARGGGNLFSRGHGRGKPARRPRAKA